MSRRRFVKLLMGAGIQRNRAQELARSRPDPSYAVSFPSFSVRIAVMSSMICRRFCCSLRAMSRAVRDTSELWNFALDHLIAGDGDAHA